MRSFVLPGMLIGLYLGIVYIILSLLNISARKKLFISLIPLLIMGIAWVIWGFSFGIWGGAMILGFLSFSGVLVWIAGRNMA